MFSFLIEFRKKKYNFLYSSFFSLSLTLTSLKCNSLFLVFFLKVISFDWISEEKKQNFPYSSFLFVSAYQFERELAEHDVCVFVEVDCNLYILWSLW